MNSNRKSKSLHNNLFGNCWNQKKLRIYQCKDKVCLPYFFYKKNYQSELALDTSNNDGRHPEDRESTSKWLDNHQNTKILFLDLVEFLIKCCL